MIILSKNQEKRYREFKEKGYIYLVASTGWGKSFISMYAIQREKKTIILAPSHLLEQWSAYLDNQEIKHSLNSFKFNVSLWSIQKFTRSFKAVKTGKKYEIGEEIFNKLKEKKKQQQENHNIFYNEAKDSLLIIDEFHRITGLSTAIYKVLQRIHAKNYFFLSATPIEKGVEDLYPALRINSVLNIKDNWGNKWRSATSFKENFCIMGGFKNYQIKEVQEEAAQKMLNELSIEHHEGGEGELIIEEHVMVNQPEIDGLIKRLKRDEDPNFTQLRTVLNGFQIINDGFDKTIKQLFKPAKIRMIKFMISTQKGKALLFYEFIHEKSYLENIPGLKFYDKKKYNTNHFEKDDAKVLAVHYRSLGEGTRVNYVDTIYMFTISVSNRMKEQAQGRPIHKGRTKKVELYIFTTNSKYEKKIVKKLNEKSDKIDKLLGRMSE